MTVIILGENQATLDLVAHFLGLAMHDNVNAAPGRRAAPSRIGPGESLGPSITGTFRARFGAWPPGIHLPLPIGDFTPRTGLLTSA